MFVQIIWYIIHFQELDELFHEKPFIDIKFAAGRKLKMKSNNSAKSPTDDDYVSDGGIRNPKCSK